MCVDENKSNTTLNKERLNSGPMRIRPCTRQRLPGASRTIRALRHPQSARLRSEDALMFVLPNGELKTNTLVSCKQRKEPMRRCRCDELDPSTFFEAPECADDVAVNGIVESEETC